MGISLKETSTTVNTEGSYEFYPMPISKTTINHYKLQFNLSPVTEAVVLY